MAFDPARVKSLFLGASDLPSLEERAAYLDRECGGEPELRARVEALLAVEDRAGPVPEAEATGVFQPTPVEGIEATQMEALETLSESPISDPEDGLATVGATGVDGEHGTLAGVPSVARRGGFVPGQVIGGRYTLLEVLGEGGMGTVYRAEQSRPVKRQVALKLIKVGMDSRTVLARFDAERQALAMMDHPNIARVYDGGATDANQPFFVMELVNGVPITDYCDRHRLSVDGRLQLFVAVCLAVQHAHQKGIIHRDLKPGNVMVTEVDGRATPKVIDFGVAKATEASLTDQSLSDTGAIVGTPTYMSPEQADPSTQDIDTRTDVYALGVILYELLAGSPPLDATQFKRGALLEMLRMVREVDPSKPSTKVSTADALPNIAANRAIDPDHLKRALRGDLDWIVMKALEKDRTRRYETANGLGADILRHLASEPVQAAPPSRSYRLRKFVRKHRVGVLAASLVLQALLAGVTGTTLGLFEARRQETLANERAEGERLAKQKALKAAMEEKVAKETAEMLMVTMMSEPAASEEEKKAKETAEAVLGFVENRIFAAARPKDQAGGLGYDVKLADAVTAALPFIEKGFPNQPLTEARLRRTIGIAFLHLGKPEIAAVQLEAARTLYSRHLGPDHPDTLTTMNNLVDSYLAAGRVREAISILEEGSNDKNRNASCSRTLNLLQAWLGQDKEYGATRQRVLAHAKGTDNAAVARHAAQTAALRPSADPEELEAVLALGRKAVELNKGEWELLALGMGEFRNGHFVAADEALLAATKAGQDVNAAGIADFYRAMSLFQQGKKDEARDVATKAAAKMKPLPRDEQNPMADGAIPDDLILWMAYKEAKALIGFDPPPAPTPPVAK